MRLTNDADRDERGREAGVSLNGAVEVSLVQVVAGLQHLEAVGFVACTVLRTLHMEEEEEEEEPHSTFRGGKALQSCALVQCYAHCMSYVCNGQNCDIDNELDSATVLCCSDAVRTLRSNNSSNLSRT